jgi:hypothetical protein
MESVPSASTRDADHRFVDNWATTPAVNTRNSAVPESACEVRCSVVARMSPDSPANRPDAAKAAIVPPAAGTGSLTLTLTLARAPARARPGSRLPGAAAGVPALGAPGGPAWAAASGPISGAAGVPVWGAASGPVSGAGATLARATAPSATMTR